MVKDSLSPLETSEMTPHDKEPYQGHAWLKCLQTRWNTGVGFDLMLGVRVMLMRDVGG